MQYAVEVLKVEHIIVCGHYGCGGVQAVLEKRELGLVSNWLRHLADIRDKFSKTLAALPSAEERARALCRLNVVEQVRHVCESTIVQTAWREGQTLAVHGWVYSLQDGLLQDLLESPVTSSAVSRTWSNPYNARFRTVRLRAGFFVVANRQASSNRLLERIRVDPRQPHQHCGIILVVGFHVIRPWVLLQQLFSLFKADTRGQSIRLRRFIRRDAGQQLAVDFESRCAIHAALLDARQREPDLAHGIEACSF